MDKLNKLFWRWKEVLLITLVIKLLLIMISLIIYPSSDLVTKWNIWDSTWYLQIAESGYSGQDSQLVIVFYPMYPLIIKVLSFLTVNIPIASVLVSIIFSIISSIALFELTLLDFSKKVAILSVWFLNIFPTAYFLQAGYTESTFLAFSLLTVYFLRKRYDYLSTIFGVFSSLTKFNGLLLIPILLFENGKNFKRILYLFSPVIGFIIYLGINYRIFNNPFYFTNPLSSNWNKELDWPWNGLKNLVSSMAPINSLDFYIYFSEAVAILLILFFGIYIFIKVRRSYGVYILVNFLLLTSTNFILSTPRYALILFPIFITLGTIKNIKIIISISIISISLLLLFTSFFIGGKWAF